MPTPTRRTCRHRTRPRADARAHPGCRQGRVRTRRPGRCTRRPHRGAGRRQQAHAVLLLRQQGRPVPRRARGHLRAHPRVREGVAPRCGRPARGDPPAGRVHLELLPRAPGVPEPAQQRQPAPRRAPEDVDQGAAHALAVRRDDPRDPRARPPGGRVPQRRRRGAALHLDRRAGVLLSRQQLHAVGDLRARPEGQEGARRAARAHDRAGARLSAKGAEPCCLRDSTTSNTSKT